MRGVCPTRWCCLGLSSRGRATTAGNLPQELCPTRRCAAALYCSTVLQHCAQEGVAALCWPPLAMLLSSRAPRSSTRPKGRSCQLRITILLNNAPQQMHHKRATQCRLKQHNLTVATGSTSTLYHNTIKSYPLPQQQMQYEELQGCCCHPCQQQQHARGLSRAREPPSTYTAPSLQQARGVHVSTRQDRATHLSGCEQHTLAKRQDNSGTTTMPGCRLTRQLKTTNQVGMCIHI
jgi:hypothetical protein